MKTLLKSLLIPALCAFFLLQAQPAAAHSKDNDVLVMDHGIPTDGKKETYGIYVYWPDKEMEFGALQTDLKSVDAVGDRKKVVKKDQ
jgi:membrane-bound inhibitor of C-type lysozyme